MEATTPRSARRMLADVLLGKPVEEWIAERRPHTSYRQLTRELLAATGGRIDITEAGLRQWAVDAQQAKSA
jgi:hypothetical protein